MIGSYTQMNTTPSCFQRRVASLTLSVIMNQRTTRSIRSSGVAPDEMAASSSDGSPQSVRCVHIGTESVCAALRIYGRPNRLEASGLGRSLPHAVHSQALNSTRDTGDRMNDGAVMLLISPLKDASDFKKLVHDPFCASA